MNAKFELQELEQNVIVQAFAQVGGTDALFEHIAQEARSFVPDVTTDKGRKAIGTLAAKVSSSKKIAEKYAIDLVAEQKAQIKVVDQDRIQFCKKMDSLRDEILAPRDAFVKAEDDRKAKHESNVAVIRMPAHIAATSDSEWTALTIKEAIETLENKVIDSSFEEYKDQAKLAKFETLEALRTALVSREKYEAEQAEHEAFEQAEKVRWQKDHDERIAREATEKAQREAEEKAHFEAEKAQREKAESEQREARLLAEKEAAVLREQALKQKAIDDAKQAEIKQQQAVEAERVRIEAEQAAKAKAEIDAGAAREADKAHKKIICGEALKGLTDLGISPERGRDILNAINKGLVPHVSIKF